MRCCVRAVWKMIERLREIETGASVASKQYQQQEDEKYGDMFIFLDGKVFKVIKSNTG